MSKAARWLDLIAFLMDRTEPVTRETIFRRIPGYRDDWRPDDETSRETLRRKFERDKDELRAWGVEIETVPLASAESDEAGSGYRLNRREIYLPYLQRQTHPAPPPSRPYRHLREIALSEHDLSVLDRVTASLMQRDELPLRTAASSLRRKLEFDLPLPVTVGERVLASPLTDAARKALAALQEAVVDRVAVTCRYYTIGRDDERRRTLEPLGLFFTWGKWYLVAFDREREDRRVFRIDRMREVRRLKHREARMTVPDDFTITSYLDRAPWELSGGRSERVVVRFAFPESRSVLARGVGDPVEPLLEDGSARVAFQVGEANAFLRWLLTFRGRAVVESPEAIRNDLEALRRAVARRYEAEP